jgi:hypothetical protein
MIRILLLAFIITNIPIMAQLPETASLVKEDKTAKLIKEIRAINEGVLLVRLRSNSRKIEALHKALRHKDAHQEELKQNHLNKEIVRSFKDYYSNSKVYFFFSSNSNLVVEKKFSVPFFLNDSLKVDSTIILDKDTKFVIAEFSSSQQRLGTPVKISGNGRKDKPTSTDGLPLRFSALRLMDDRFEQLSKPLPRHVRTYQTIPFLRRSVEKSVKRLDAKLKV